MGNIPINVRNTNTPNDKGTVISCKIYKSKRPPGSLIGIAGKKGFSVVRLEKAGMNEEVGFLKSICQIMESYGINVEHVPGGIDTLSIIVANKDFEPSKKAIIDSIGLICKLELITVENMALICVAIHDMVETPGVAARLCQSLSNAKINIRMINQGASAISIIIGVNEKDYEEAVRAIYKDFTS
jgi:aspartate kinase